MEIFTSFGLFLTGAVAGFAAWHVYFTTKLPDIVKRVGYLKRGKTRRTRVKKEKVSTADIAEKLAAKMVKE